MTRRGSLTLTPYPRAAADSAVVGRR